jgi:hypothetical protein
MLSQRLYAASLGAALLGSALLTGCTPAESPDPAPASTPVAQPTPLSAYDTESIAVTRGPFCDRVSPTGIEAALGGAATQHDSWDNGDPPPVGDVGNEYGCAWSRKRTIAQAWVFAPPVTPARARRLAAGEAEMKCAPLKGQPDFGTFGAPITCGLNTGARLVRFAGLFGDAWLTCEVLSRRPDPAVVDTATQWCAHVLDAART